MKTKLISLLGLVAVIAIIPALVSAQQGEKKPPLKKIAETEQKAGEIKKDLKQEVKELKDLRGASSTATSSKDKRADIRDIRTKIFRLSAGLQKTVAREINQVKNIIARMTGAGSVIVKLETAGINTTAIKTKLTEASTLADKAQTSLDSAKEMIASSTASTASTSVQTLKNRVDEARKALASAHTYAKLATAKIKDARKLIGQIPGLREIEGRRATSTAKTSPAGSGKNGTTTDSDDSTSSRQKGSITN